MKTNKVFATKQRANEEIDCLLVSLLVVTYQSCALLVELNHVLLFNEEAVKLNDDRINNELQCECFNESRFCGTYLGYLEAKFRFGIDYIKAVLKNENTTKAKKV